MSYLKFIGPRNSASGLTKIFDVISGSATLGEIRWYAPWRRYCFFTFGQIILDRGCMGEISVELDILNENHKK